MEKTDTLLAPIIRQLGIEEGVRLVRMKDAWQNIIGEPLSSHMYPARLSDGKLLLNVDSPIWIQQLNFCKKDILQKLSPFGVNDLRFRVGKLPGKTASRSARTNLPRLQPEEEAFIDETVSTISDVSLRETVKRAAEKSIRSSKRKR